ncbi:MAG: phosphoethanolamine--lipid A transferase [Gammaproteobacteria bacterium]|uniref:phosphoethanolamine transferase n=1 Tax=Rhodoferax sp. TaxID=50421 RepID=UPI0017CA7C58|nr:phosphoethanolamine--lipid A transferase [Rhodoferax sp.]MBU3900679.1 phosphoethanolamine--lipid A transferase [Gammaproteobacteria bacterium]MBA3058132.1 phosphoethanolamine--lipid A transferase [Rhodoferax sp.]MBU3998395.1 phosphoethanolamine--lipid A transferase [Gammaproteobacteria bacterium]MBU4081337.1 phosphoethanolamine--lipid A transferase [Gammaproteobacteria bacterium]MBU4114525.1 phosphoethanolamine--lipid A transferase [Gammaproteobacteria bacterium]
MMPARLRHPVWLILAASLWMATAGNAPLWRALSQLSVFDSLQGWLFATALALIIVAALTGLISLLAWRWTLKPVLGLFLLAAAAGAYFMMSYHVVIDPTMIVNALQTDPREVRDLLSAKLFISLLLLWALPMLVVWRWPVVHVGWTRRSLHNLLQTVAAVLALALLVLASFSPLSSTLRNHKELRYLINPLNSAYAAGYLAARPFQRDDSIIDPIGLDAHVLARVRPSRAPLVLLVLGETGRSGNFGLNGYPRDTTPELARHNVASLRNAWSCGTSTATSVPCMFSALGRQDYEAREHNAEGLLDVIQRAGMAVLWLDNQSGCKGTCDRVPNVSTSHLADSQHCRGGECYDGVMLQGLDARIDALPAERRAQGVVVVMHQMGSHGPAYYLRSPTPYKRFTPECASNDLQSCSAAELVNAYDNSIAYTDHFLASTIDWLKTQQSRYDPALVYVADHGESLGENNLYLHGMPYLIAPEVQKKVPWITWLSPAYAERSQVTLACLRARADQPVSHDNYFHSILGLLGIQSQVYQRALDIYASCKPDAPAQARAAGLPSV